MQSLFPSFASHMAADVSGVVTFVSVLILRCYLLWRTASLRPWQVWLGALIDGAGGLLYRIAEALLIAVLVAFLTERGVVGDIATCFQYACRI